MRLKSEIWVKAYLRRLGGEGIAAAVIFHGDDTSGAIYIKVATLDGRAFLFGPAPAGLADSEVDRRWVRLDGGAGLEERAADERMRREREFDRDLWLIEVEDRQGRHRLEDWLAPGNAL